MIHLALWIISTVFVLFLAGWIIYAVGIILATIVCSPALLYHDIKTNGFGEWDWKGVFWTCIFILYFGGLFYYWVLL